MRLLRVVMSMIVTLIITDVSAQVSVPWTSTDGPLAGKVQCFVWTEDGAIYIGTDASGVYRSVDGLSWKRTSTGLQEQDVRELAVEPDGGLLALTYGHPYQGNHSPILEPALGYLYRSTNQGASWAVVDTIEISALLVDTRGNIWRGRDTWDVGSWFMRSTNGGTVWEQKIASFVGHPLVSVLVMDSTGNLFLGQTDDSATKATWRSTNNGTSWSKIVTNVELWNMAASKGGYIFGIDLPNRLVRMKNDGTGYTILDSSFTARGFTFLANGNVYAVENDGSVIRSTNNGVSWTTAASATYGAERLCGTA